MLLRTFWFGSFIISEGVIVEKLLFPGEPDELANRIQKIQQGKILEEEKELVKKYDSIYVFEKRLSFLENSIFIEKKLHNEAVSYPVEKEDTTIPKYLEKKERNDIIDSEKENRVNGKECLTLAPEEHGYSKSLLKKTLILQYSKKLQEKLRHREIIEITKTLDDLNQAVNTFDERKSEWSEIYDGSEIPKIFNDFLEFNGFIQDFRRKLIKKIEKKMKEMNPNLSQLAGELLGARLISLAGGRKELAHLPASTVQILGAEKAFFRFRKDGTGMPKHGIIFMHPWIRGSEKNIRGKIARMFASKISIVARIDYYSGRNIGAELRDTVKEKVKSIRKNKK